MKDLILVFVGLLAGGLGVNAVFCQKEAQARSTDPRVIEEKLKEVGEVIFGEKPMQSETTVKIPKEYKILGKVVATDAVKIHTKWRGLHRFGVDMKNNPVRVEDQKDKLLITLPAWSQRVSYLEPGSLEFDLVDGSVAISKDKRYRVAVHVTEEQNRVNGSRYMYSDDGMKELKAACQSAITGIVYPHVKTRKPLEVVCTAPEKPEAG